MSVIDTLIFDRTQSDITNDTDKAYISYEDLNRVEQAIEYVRNILVKYGYIAKITSKNWYISDLRDEYNMERIRKNIESIRNVFPYYNGTETPSTIKYESIEEANNIEKILYYLNFIVNSYMNYFVRCGVCNIGQNSNWQRRFRSYKNWSSQPYKLSQYLEDDKWSMIATDDVSNNYGETRNFGFPIVDTRDSVYITIGNWSNAIQEIDDLVGVIE